MTDRPDDPEDDRPSKRRPGKPAPKPSTEREKPYKVGKNRPPIEHRFKKGGKGGPGRPKGSRGRSSYDKLLDERVVVGEDRLGRRIRKTWRELINVQLAKQAGQGDLRAIGLSNDYELKLLALNASKGPAPPTAEELRLHEEEMAKREILAGKLAGLLKWGVDMKKDGIITNLGPEMQLAPWLIEAIADYREKHGRTRDPGPGESWNPHPPTDEGGPE